MPYSPIDYSKTIIYKIVCKDVSITDCYVGQTTDFKSRKSKHKYSCSNQVSKTHNFYVYLFIRKNGNWENWDMIEIEKYPCDDSLNACKRERYWVEYYKATLNTNIPSRTDQEWKEENKEILLEYHKKYRDDNKEEISEKHKKYYEDNKIILLEYHQQYYIDNREYCLERQKQYYIDNKEHYTDYKKQHYIDNREYCLERQKLYGKEKITCDCGDIITKSSLFRHRQRKTHLQNMSKLN